MEQIKEEAKEHKKASLRALDELKEKGIKLVDKKARRGAEGLDIAFIHPKETYGVLTELCEKPST